MTVQQHHGEAGPARGARLVPVAGLIFALLVTWAWRFTMDDAYITLRYVRHVLAGLGPVWNPADVAAPVEGFTSYLHVWLLAGLGAVLGIDLALLAKGLGVVCGAALLAGVACIVLRRRLAAPAAIVVLSPFALPWLALHSVSGMETMLFVVLSTATALSAIAVADGGRRSSMAAFAGLGCLATLTRPEFGLPVLMMAGWLLWRRPKQRAELCVWLALLFVLPGLAVTAQRWQVYGDVVPNAFHVKQRSRPNRWGLLYTAQFLVVVAFPYLVLIAHRLRALWTTERDWLFVTGIWSGCTLLYFTSTVPTMGWWHRYLVPLLPMLALLAGLRFDGGGRRARVSTRVALGVALAFVAVQIPLLVRWIDGHHRHELLYAEAGRRLAPFAGPDRWMAFYDVGRLVYEAEWNTKDVVGLNTRFEDLGSPCDMRTDLVLRVTTVGKTPDPCPGLYRPLARLPFLRQPSGLAQTDMVILGRTDLPDAEALGGHLARGWPGPYRRSDEWLAAYWRRLSPFFFR